MIAGSFFLEDYTSLMLSSLLIASVSAGPTSTTSIGPSPIKNHCVDGVVPHSYMVTLTLPDHSDLGRPLDTKEKLSFLQDWVRQYTHEDTTNTAPTTAASSTPTPSHARATNYFTAIMFGVAVEAGDKVRHACNTPRAPMYSSTPVPAPSVPVSLYRRVLSIPYSHI